MKVKITRYGVVVYEGEAAGIPQTKPKTTTARTQAEQEEILKLCFACPFDKWQDAKCILCSGKSCFSSRLANKNMHCPKAVW